MPTNNFYRDIPPLKLSVAEVFQEQNFHDVPDDWTVIVADIQNSTAAVAAGKHNDVNLVAAGCLIAALNVAREKKIEIPFFFGGDGGTVLAPAPLAENIMTALLVHNDNSIKNFGLALHLGSINMQSILYSGSSIKISKLQAGSGFHKAIVIGDGLKFAEREIKQRSSKPAQVAVDYALNLNGLECRWDKIKPPVQDNEIVCYLIEARDKQKQVEVFRNVLRRIDDIYGSLENRSPLSPARLKLLSSLHKAQSEMLVKYGGWNLAYLLRTFFTTLLGNFYFKNNLNIGNIRAQDYLLQLIANADTLTIDGRINTIISGKKSKRFELLEYLADQEQKGVLVFGHHISKESIMTCYIENMNSDHIHFVDGSDGGYTEAARELKRKAIIGNQ